ncbi:hypothetical protein QFZ77_002464 [Paenibacillus sp. V4I3]|uniref:hypothetical protein n=1 Tax=Paenibacillus sp. V4I3 TaxID=3042305 RepID=UPI002786266E|nr:hypothetical protein [Paenibacillus sp. V4I3]MDQ0873805.1 hypothetical protein [Paenibacillus sp. V4I3]
MKQRITIEDLNTLTDEQKVHIQKWWKPKQGDYALSAENNNQSNGKTVVLSTVAKHPREFYGEKGVFVAFFVYENKDNGHMGNLDKLYPLLSIGQMIEFLRNQTEFSLDTHKDKFGVSFKQDDGKYISWDKVELCDALFAAVKQVI